MPIEIADYAFANPPPMLPLGFYGCYVIARSKATKQSSTFVLGAMDCFAEPVTGRRFAPTRWLAMTV
jgi:hypothetical protein